MKSVNLITGARTREGQSPAAGGGTAPARGGGWGLPGVPPGKTATAVRTFGGAGLAALVALPVAATDAACHFTVECFEDEPCDEADFVLRIRSGDAPMSVRLGGPVDRITGELSVAESGATLILARSPSSLQILTIGPDDTARYTLHLTDGPAMVSYIGTCEDE